MGNVPDHLKAEAIVTKCFLELVQHEVAAVLPQDTLDRYIEKCCESIDPKTLYDSIIRGVIRGSQRHHLWSADEVTLSCAYTQSLGHIVEKYILDTNDYAALKEWLPLLNTERLTEIVENYPDSADYKQDDRTFDNYLIRNHAISEEEMFAIKDLPRFDNSNRVTEHIPKDCLPLMYYEGSGNNILVATAKQI